MIDKEAWAQAPCGKCTYCRIQRAAQWTVRLMHEYSTSFAATFVTLTYEDEYLPMIENEGMLYPSLEPAHLTNFIKSLRQTTKNKIKYFASGEYGDETHRPHYHIILFNYPVRSSAPRREIDDIWNYGSTHSGTVTYESCRYVAGYVQKKWYGNPQDSPYYPAYPPFGRQSQGLGLAFARKNEQQLLRNAGTTIQGKPIGLPRYYLKKLIGDDQKKRSDYLKVVADKEIDNIELHLNRLDEVEKCQQYYIDKSSMMIKGKYMAHEIAERSKERGRRQYNENLESKDDKTMGRNL